VGNTPNRVTEPTLSGHDAGQCQGYKAGLKQRDKIAFFEPQHSQIVLENFSLSTDWLQVLR
jgi:hypothetical protein